VDLGFAATRGNAITSTFNTEFNAARATKTDKVSLYMTAIRASNTTAGVKLQTANATRGGVKYNRSVSDRWSTFGFTDLEFDEFQRLDLRVVTGGGMEYEIVKREDMAFNVQAGGSFNKEYFANNTTRKSGELVAGQSFTYKLFRITELEEKLIVYPNMTERGQYRINFDIGTITRLNKWLSFRFSVSNRYLSNPLPGNKTNDVLLSTGIRVSFADKPRVVEVGLVIAEFLIAAVTKHAAAGAVGDGVGGGGIPFHGGPEARIDVGAALFSELPMATNSTCS